MSPLLQLLLTTPMGWLAIGLTVAALGITVAIHLFLRRKIRESEAAIRGQDGPPKR